MVALGIHCVLGTAEVVSVRRGGVAVRTWRDVGSFEDCSLLLPGLETSFQPLSDTVRNQKGVLVKLLDLLPMHCTHTWKLGTISTCQNSEPCSLC